MKNSDPNDEAIELTREIIDLLTSDPYNAIKNLSTKIYLFDELTNSLEIFDKISEKFLELELKGADKQILSNCEHKIRDKILELERGSM